MKKAPDIEYEEMKSFLGAWVERSGILKSFPPEYHPLAVADRIEKDHGRSKAKQGLKMAVNDCLEEAADLDPSEVKKIDEEYDSKGIPALSTMRQRYSKKYRQILKRKKIKNEVEYYLIKGIIDSRFSDFPEDEAIEIEEMMWEFEKRFTKK